MAAVTPLDIANMALGLLTEAPIDSLDEDSRAARMLRAHYETTREAELTKYVWHFAVLTNQISASLVDDALRYRYELPADCLRLVALQDFHFEFVQRADGLYSNYAGPLKLTYVANIIDPNDWPSVFTDVLTAALAVKIAHPITGKVNMLQLAKETYRDALSTALRVNAVQKATSRRSRTWEEARGGVRAGLTWHR